MERTKFVAEGKLEVSPKESYFAMLGGEYMGELLLEHFGGQKERGYTDLGRVRVTVERLGEPEA
jgi:hypothetical protein